VRSLGIWDPGAKVGRKAEDKEIAEWCAQHRHILVTCDTDFRSKEIREGILKENSIDVIWFLKQPKDFQEQARMIPHHYPAWVEKLRSSPPGYQWEQPRRGRIRRKR
jgi:predicted nuclease of predicted toxin-antitoxin system